uniref:Uncharacterized protein n=1 Tax=Oryza glumipatula TaxID=40148 RepID=A0A0E0BSA2_9ORYZ
MSVRRLLARPHHLQGPHRGLLHQISHPLLPLILSLFICKKASNGVAESRAAGGAVLPEQVGGGAPPAVEPLRQEEAPQRVEVPPRRPHLHLEQRPHRPVVRQPRLAPVVPLLLQPGAAP